MAFTVLQMFFKIVPNFHLLNCQTQLSNFWRLDYWKMHYQSKPWKEGNFSQKLPTFLSILPQTGGNTHLPGSFFQKSLSNVPPCSSYSQHLEQPHPFKEYWTFYLADVIYRQSKHTFLRIFCTNEPTCSPEFLFKWSFAFRFPWQLCCHISQDGHSNPIFLLHEI